MRRQATVIGAFVFACSAVAELLSIDVMAGSVGSWLHHPRRMVLLTTMLAVNVTNSVVAGFLVSRMRRAQLAWKSIKHEREVTNKYVNHHVRNSLAAIRYAAFLTKNEQAIGICNDCIDRILAALKAAERGVGEMEEWWKVAAVPQKQNPPKNPV